MKNTTIFHLFVIEDGEPISFGFFLFGAAAYEKQDEMNDEFYDECSYSKAFVIEGNFSQS